MAVCGQLRNSVLRAPPSVLLFSLHFIHIIPEGATTYLHDHIFLIQDGHMIQAYVTVSLFQTFGLGTLCHMD